MAVEPIAVEGVAPPTGQFNHAVRAGGLVAVSGQVGLDASGRLVGPDVGEQTRQAFENLRAVLASAGCGFADVLRLTIYIAAPALAPAVAEVRRDFLVEPWPASTMVVAQLLSPEWLVEIDAIAAAPA
jgi:enamine deaminase RidA (YjgF/YER057c/UK114 family)